MSGSNRFFDPAPIIQQLGGSQPKQQPPHRVPDNQYFRNWDGYNRMIAGIKHSAVGPVVRKMEAPKAQPTTEVYRQKADIAKTGLTPHEIKRGLAPGVAPRAQSLLTDE